MDPAVRRLIDHPWAGQKTYEKIAALLPADDAELDRWFADLVAVGDAHAFMKLGIAALGANRSVDGRHLVRGAMLVTDGPLLGCFAWHMTGDVPEHLLAATSDSQIIPSISSMALFVVAAICQERRGGAYPPELITRARLLARVRSVLGDTGLAALCGIAEITRDPALAAILEIDFDAKREKAEKLTRTLKSTCSGSPYALVAPEPRRQLGRGFTMRRAVPRIGRNDPCPCQSGRKYKSCCMAADAERLHDSSHVAGKSQAELRAEPEPYLTTERLGRALAHELIRFDPLKIPPALLKDFFFGLCAYSLFDRALECFEILGFAEHLDEACDSFLFLAERDRRSDAIKRLLALHPRSTQLQETMIFGAKLAMVDDDPARYLSVLEEGALAALRSDDPEFLQLYGYSLLHSKVPATGIFVTRALITFADDELAQVLLDELVITRDKLGLTPDDPAGDLLEKRLLEATRTGEAEDTEESRALAEARERLHAKAREVEFLRHSLENARRDVKKRESRPPADSGPSSSNVSTSAPDERALQELRFKVQKLKGELNERHEERVALRQELREAHAKLESHARSPVADATARDNADPEAEHHLPGDPAEIQPVRLPEFPRKFDETLQALPRHVARNALTTIGRLAAGDLAAFSGVVRLKACPDIYRQRIGADHRLLFRLTPDRLVIIDLINRRDLERRIKTLASGAY